MGAFLYMLASAENAGAPITTLKTTPFKSDTGEVRPGDALTAAPALHMRTTEADTMALPPAKPNYAARAMIPGWKLLPITLRQHPQPLKHHPRPFHHLLRRITCSLMPLFVQDTCCIWLK